MASTEKSRGNSVGRVLRVMRALADGRVLDRHGVTSLLGITPAAADRVVRTFAKHWPELASDSAVGKRALRFPKPKAVPRPVAVAASFGASLSRLFEGSSYEAASRTAQERVLAHVRNPGLFDAFDRKFYFVIGGGEMMLPDRSGFLDELVDAVLLRTVVEMDYLRFSGEAITAVVKPLSIAVYAHQLYVIGRDRSGQDHPFRFSRIESVERTDETFEYPAKADYDPSQVFADSFGVIVGPEYPVATVRVLLAANWATFAHRHRWHRSQKVTLAHDGVVVELKVRVCPEVEAWILGFGEEAEVLAPSSLRERVRARIQAMAQKYPSGPAV